MNTSWRESVDYYRFPNWLFFGKHSAKYWLVTQNNPNSMYASLNKKTDVLLWCDARSGNTKVSSNSRKHRLPGKKQRDYYQYTSANVEDQNLKGGTTTNTHCHNASVGSYDWCQSSCKFGLFSTTTSNYRGHTKVKHQESLAEAIASAASTLVGVIHDKSSNVTISSTLHHKHLLHQLSTLELDTHLAKFLTCI